MDYSGEYYISPEDYENTVKKILRNKKFKKSYT